MNERIKLIRKHFGLSQTEFGARIGVKQTSVAGYETGARVPLDAVINAICKEFRVRDEWLRTGEGEMFYPISRDKEIASYTDALLSDSPDSLRSIVISYLMKWDVEDWEAVAKILKKHGLPQIKDKEEPVP